MKSFKQLISESPYVLDDDNYERGEHQLKHYDKLVRKTGSKSIMHNSSGTDYKEIGSTDTHKIYRKIQSLQYRKDAAPTSRASFLAVDKKTNEAHLNVNGNWHNKNKILTVDSLKGHPESTLKAHDFYHHLLMAGHVNKLVSDKIQSQGGKKVWKKLSTLPHVKLTGSDGKFNRNFDANYSDSKTDPDSAKLGRTVKRRLIAKVKL